MRFDGVLFDMDGVLVDSEEFICQAAMSMFAEKGLKTKADDFIPFIGAGEDRYLGGVAEHYGLKIDLPEAKRRTYELYADISKKRLQPLPGVKSFIDTCLSLNLKLAVATSADEIKMRINIREIGLEENMFDALIYGELIKHKKPSPEIYLRAAADIKCSPARCLVIEDAVNGVEAAKTAGCKCLAVTTSFQEKDLQAADWVFNTLEEVPESLFF